MIVDRVALSTEAGGSGVPGAGGPTKGSAGSHLPYGKGLKFDSFYKLCKSLVYT